MVEPNGEGPLILDISSDEDLACDWISELFSDSDEARDDESDEVVVISEVLGSNNNNMKQKKKKVDDDYDDDDDDDDDCVILEDDPDKIVDEETCGGLESEDLVIVSQKGKIACRDYPHARHLCAKFLFASTPHEQHCDQCHCYVCDSLAPCIYWGNGGSNTDHCHSTDQDPIWKAQRQNLKQENKALSLPLKPPDVALFLPPPPQAISFPTSTPVQNQIPRLSNSSISHLTHQRRTHPNKFNPCLVSQQLLSSCNVNNNNTNRIIGRPTPTNLSAQCLSRPELFKNTGSNLVAPPNARPGYGTHNYKYAPRYPRNPHPLPNLRNRRNSTYQKKTPFAGSQMQPCYGGSSMGPVPLSQSQFNGHDSVVNSICSPLSQPLNGNNSGVNSISSPLSLPQLNRNNSGVNSISSPLSQPQFNRNNSSVNSISRPLSQPQYNGNNSSVNSISSPLSQSQYNGNNGGVNSISRPLSQPQFNENNSGVNSVSSPLSQPQFNGNSSAVNSVSIPLYQPQFNGNNSAVNSISSQPQASRNQFTSSLASQQSALQTTMGSTSLDPMAPPYYPIESYSQPNIVINNYENSLPHQPPTLSQSSTSNSGFINPIYTQNQTYSQPNYEQQENGTISATDPNSTAVGPTDQYNLIDSFPAEDPALCQRGIPDYDYSDQYPLFYENDPWMGGYVGTDGFDLDLTEAVTVDTGSLFDHPAFD